MRRRGEASCNGGKKDRKAERASRKLDEKATNGEIELDEAKNTKLHNGTVW